MSGDNRVPGAGSASVQERLRYRDLVLQAERFLRYAPKGTAKSVLAKEAKAFDQRLSAFPPELGGGKRNRLSTRLKAIYFRAE